MKKRMCPILKLFFASDMCEHRLHIRLCILHVTVEVLSSCVNVVYCYVCLKKVSMAILQRLVTAIFGLLFCFCCYNSKQVSMIATLSSHFEASTALQLQQILLCLIVNFDSSSPIACEFCSHVTGCRMVITKVWR